MNADTSSLRTNTNTLFAAMKQESSNFSKVVQEDNSKRALNQAPICSASDGVKKDIVINSAAPLSMGIVPTAQLITLQLNNVTSKPLEKLTAGPVFTNASRSHSIPVPILAKPVSSNVPRRRIGNTGHETLAFHCQNFNRFRHKSSQTDGSVPQTDVLTEAIKKITCTLDEMKVKLTSVQSKVASLEDRFAAVYGDDTLSPNADPSKSGSGYRPCLTSSCRRSLVHSSSRFWASRRLASRLAAEKLQRVREDVRNENVEESSKIHPLTAPTPPTLAIPRSGVAVRRSRRFISDGKVSDLNGAGTKAKIAKLLMDARLEMAAEEEKERLEVQASNSATAGASMAPDVIKPIHLLTQQPTMSACLTGIRVDSPTLPPILPLLTSSVLEAAAAASSATTVPTSAAVVDSIEPSACASEDETTGALPTQVTSSKSIIAISGSSTPPTSSSPSTLPQLPPIPAKYRRPMLLDTSEIARQTKDMLLKCAISQRSFGQNVLGLSQGSVSDLLTRPKPWSMLTNKGREPFIRMKLFLENPRSLNGFEYNISMGKDAAHALKQERSDESTSSQQPPDSPTHQESLISESASPTAVSSTTEVFKGSIIDAISTSSPILIAPAGPITTAPATTSPLLGPVCPFPTKVDSSGRSSISIRSLKAQRLLKEGFDVMKTVSDAKLLLNTTSMTQRALGNTILGLSQASVSDLLCKSRPWDQISGNKPRESYVRLKLWVDSVRAASGLPDDPSESQSVTERKSKRQRTDSGSSSPLTTITTTRIVVDTETNKQEEVQENQLTEQQLDVLVNFFDQCPDPDPNDISELAKQICSSLDEVNEWFEKRRQDAKPSTPVSIKKEEVLQPITEKECNSPAASNNQSTPTASLNRRKKTVPTRILPSSLDVPPLESAPIDDSSASTTA